MKLGLIFSDRDLITRSNGDRIITKKEHIAYFGAVGEFKKSINRHTIISIIVVI